jgi:hypothetical protein
VIQKSGSKSASRRTSGRPVKLEDSPKIKM